MLALGILAPADAPFAIRWDKREDYTPDECVDCGWIGEDADGVWTTLHPTSALARDPLLWDVVAEWRYAQHAITAEDYATKSAFELDAKLTLAAAHAREDIRRIKKGRDDAE